MKKVLFFLCSLGVAGAAFAEMPPGIGGPWDGLRTAEHHREF